MYHDFPRGVSWLLYLLAVDRELADEVRAKGCSCGGKLHSADYLRKPAGLSAQLFEPMRLRLSFCCDRDGCRKRTTPPSVRFLGRKVYVGATIILISAMRQGPSPRRVRELSERFGVTPRTIARWQVLWREHFPQTPFWKIARGSMVPAIEIASLPYSLVDAFLSRHDPDEGWIQLLRFLAPISIPGCL
jgi:hypothetical protein